MRSVPADTSEAIARTSTPVSGRAGAGTSVTLTAPVVSDWRTCVMREASRPGATNPVLYCRGHHFDHPARRRAAQGAGAPVLGRETVWREEHRRRARHRGVLSRRGVA